MTSDRSSIKRANIAYRHGDVQLEGMVAFDDSSKDRRPGVLVCHAWMGLDAYARRRAVELAKLGFVAFALDMYGKDVVANNAEEAAKLMESIKSRPKLLRERVNAGLTQLREHRLSESRRLAAIGYCFGGHVALELARTGADLQGVVSFHGLLDTKAPHDGKIKAKLLVLHGDADPLVPPPQVNAFHEEMRKAGCDWEFDAYGGAVHAFTNPDAGSDKSSGLAHDANAERRSWLRMRGFFEEIFA